ncbi:nuclease [Sphaerisporangium siamense]|uniref:Endonuclease/exonuclease/phosphatase family metal-dependent hydrolase n=1 Tax=Sphaerisporangium siamense TaxID=795645 RepID=A0A7W7DGV7_9ACTN|nr:endonuclease/exonuclease/phosphatase family protein [Sphaerisporangium siamense]MBB4705123.1 endonuclease/exonuclease/phosphatase family metal-dependent hydrolase [Sphaerisporangium siamense]GII83929.1 nuclease [Sphaerisporangium siamense]
MVVVGTWNLENLYRPGGEFGPGDTTSYQAKIKALATTITGFAPDVLGVQEVGDPEALDDLTAELGGEWHTALSGHPDARGIRVGVISRFPLTVQRDVSVFAAPLAAVQNDDTGPGTSQTSRGMLAVQVEPTPGTTLSVAVCHLKSKLLSFPGGRFAARDEGERARFGAYALYRRAAEATTLRGLADALLDGQGRRRPLVVLGDFNDEPQAATTQIVLGPPGSELGTPGALRPDKGDAWRLWNLATRIEPAADRYSRIHQGKGELIDHILVSRALIERVAEMRSVVSHGLPSISEDPTARRDAADSDHAPLYARLDL